MSDKPQNQVFVAGYSKNRLQSKSDIKEIFKDIGHVKDVAYKGSFSFVVSEMGLMNRGDFFLNKAFESEADALAACKEYNNRSYNGQKLKVEIVDSRGGGRKREASDVDECFHCGEKGHWARDCKNKKNSQSRPARRRKSDSRSRSRRRRRSRSSGSSRRRRRRDDSSSRSYRRRHRRSRHRSRSYSQSKSSSKEKQSSK